MPLAWHHVTLRKRESHCRLDRIIGLLLVQAAGDTTGRRLNDKGSSPGKREALFRIIIVNCEAQEYAQGKIDVDAFDYVLRRPNRMHTNRSRLCAENTSCLVRICTVLGTDKTTTDGA
jgi:hypothetical protein